MGLRPSRIPNRSAAIFCRTTPRTADIPKLYAAGRAERMPSLVRSSARGARAISLFDAANLDVYPFDFTDDRQPRGKSFAGSTGKEQIRQDRLQSSWHRGCKALERAKGIEPSYAAWEAAVLPL